MNSIAKLTMMLGMALASTAGHAQLMEITAADTTGLSNGFLIAPGGDFKPLVFENGKMTYDKADIKPFTSVSIMTLDNMFNAIVEPGQTLQIKLAKKGGKWNADYKGKNAPACIFQDAYLKLSASGWEEITLDEYDEEITTMKESFDFAKESARVDKQYALCKKLAGKVEPADLRERYLAQTEALYLSSRLAIAKASEQMAGRDPKNSDAVKSIIAEIDPNNIYENEHQLPLELVKANLTTTQFDSDLTAYGIDLAKTTDRLVSNQTIRHGIYESLASSLLNSDYNGQSFDLDKFWEVYQKVADQDLIDYYQTVVDSRHATMSGAKCPDETFIDPQGNKHQLSEFFGKGKYTYIDIWATWCIPCVAEIPYVEKHVEHYKDNPKIQFISISLDQDHDAWHRKLDKDKPSWQQFLSSTEEDMNKLMKDWGITGIPRFVLINPDGTINNASAFRPSEENFYELMDAIIK